MTAMLVACNGSAVAPPPSATDIATASVTSAAATTPPASSAAGSPSPTPITLPNSAAIAAAGNGVVWALVGIEGARLFRSLDRGDTWQERPLPPVGPSSPMFAFVSDREGWLAAAGQPGTQCTFQDLVLFHTSDGAATWDKISPTGIGATQCKTALAFNDATHGYLTTYDENSAPRVYRTSDGGATWSASPPFADPPSFTSAQGGGELRTGPVADFVTVAYVSAFGTVNGELKQYIYRSTDRAGTWAYFHQAPMGGAPTVFLTPVRWLQIAIPGASQETTDSGANWHGFTSDYTQAAPIAPAIVFGDATTGYASVRGSIQRTIDGGLHWTRIKTPGTLSP